MFGKKNNKSEQVIETDANQSLDDNVTFTPESDDISLDFDDDMKVNEVNDTTENNIENTEVKSKDIKVSNDADSNNTQDEAEKPKDLILYIIMDKSNNALLQYYRECGINVSKIFTNINSAKDTLLMQVDPVKILVIDTGTGRFSAMGSRKELIDLMGICDEDARISVYYTDTVIKSEVEYNESFENRDIHWHKFRSNADVVAHLLRNKNKENYVFDNEDKDKVVEVAADILDFTGLKFVEAKQANANAGDPSITLNDIKVHMVDNESTEGEIEGYNIVKI